jgi:dephospho-CoA kinase
MLIVALTGGIATGKSVIAAYLKKRGCYIHHADLAARDLMKPGRPAWKAVIQHFGSGILNPDGSVNRPRLGQVIFSNQAEREYLNRLIHPLVLARKKRVIRRLEKSGRYRIFVSEAALTIEAGFTSLFDKIIVAHCPEEIQVRRLMERDGLGRRDARRRIGSQMPAAEKLRQADYIIDTSGTLEETARQTEWVYRRLLCDDQKKRRGQPGGG